MNVEVLNVNAFRGATAALLSVLLLGGCGSSPSDPVSGDPPAITIGGVAEGQTYSGPVTITIAVDRGSYEATLDGAAFLSGRTVSTPGPHALVVTARNGTRTATKQIAFTIAGAEGGALIIRLLDLGANAAGGGGDAILLTDSTAAGMVHGLIDAGPAGANGSNPGYVAQQLGLLGVQSLEFVQLTHAHSDHFDGLPAVFQAFRAKRFIYNGQVRSYAVYNNLLTQAGSRSDTVITPTGTSVHTLRLGNGPQATLVSTLPPLPTFITSAHPDSSAQFNEGSLGTEVELGTFRMFFTGDGEVRANQRWRTQFATYSGDVEVLKAGHHGANDAVFDDGAGFSTASAWLSHTWPEVAVISSNGTTRPRVRALSALRTGRAAYCTNVHGRIEIRVLRSGSYTVRVEKNASLDCVAGSQATS